MEGHRVDSALLPNEELEYWIAATKFHMTPDQWDALPAVRCDWLLAIDGVFEGVKARGG